LSSPDAETTGGGTARARLHGISRHFLSDDVPYRIALCAASDDAPPLPADGLARALADRGRTVACVDSAASLVTLTRRDTEHNLTAERPPGAEPLAVMLAAPDLMLIATCGGHEIAACDLALFAVPARADGLRSAYLRLKALARSDRRPPIGVTLTGADDCRAAARCFDRLAVAARDFLGIELASYSYLPADPRRTEAALADIARLLLEDRRATRRPDRDRTGIEGAAAHVTTGVPP
jgi:hypothetical protein